MTCTHRVGVEPAASEVYFLEDQLHGRFPAGAFVPAGISQHASSTLLPILEKEMCDRAVITVLV